MKKKKNIKKESIISCIYFYIYIYLYIFIIDRVSENKK